MVRSLLIVALVTAAGCAKNHATVKEASVEQVSEWMKAGTASVFDANNESFRQKYGKVAGAVLLDKYNAYDVSVLGTDKTRQLVFYCSNRL